jgi:threonine synthase
MCRKQAIRFGDPLNVVVPTGNFGNILAAYFAKMMGLPLKTLICASNSNNVLSDFINTGCYDRNRQFYTTVSPSMDILVSSNLERLLYYITGEDAAKVGGWMQQLQSGGSYCLDAGTEAKVKENFFGGFASESETLATIKDVYQSSGRVLDTHTAVGRAVYQKYLKKTGDETPMLLAATASPYKFNTSVVKAIAGDAIVTGRDEFELLHDLSELSGTTIPQALSGLNQKPVRHQTVCDPGDLGNVVQKILGIE